MPLSSKWICEFAEIRSAGAMGGWMDTVLCASALQGYKSVMEIQQIQRVRTLMRIRNHVELRYSTCCSNTALCHKELGGVAALSSKSNILI